MEDVHLSSTLCPYRQQTPLQCFHFDVAIDEVAGYRQTCEMKLYMETIACWKKMGQRVAGDIF